MTKLESIEMSADEEALALLCHAANNLRRYFHGQVVAVLPDNARRALENEISFLAQKPADTPWPPLATLTMEHGEQCLLDLIAYNHDGAASDHFRDCVNKTVEAVVAAIND